MKKVISTERVPIKMWLEDCDEGAIEQSKNIANLPFVLGHVVLLPDCHKGYGFPIGCVMATNNVVAVGAVGVDIGCGMAAMRTSLTSIMKEEIQRIMGGNKESNGGIKFSIPTGFSHHVKAKDEMFMPRIEDFSNDPEYDMLVVLEQYDSARKQIGTLGGGNHFCEFQQSGDGSIWVMIHSGSRNLGYKVAQHYGNIAKKMNARWYSAVNPKHDLSFLPIDSEAGDAYMKEMNYCIAFAKKSREMMMLAVQEEFSNVFPDVLFGDTIDVAHNYARMEHHFGSNVMIHRKGATSARDWEIGIIPGSQGTKSYIVKGRGNVDSFMSCSHGAGRAMSRTKAREKLSLESEIKRLDDLGIIHGIKDKNGLDEAAGAYKDISVVMENQNDLVDILVELSPLAVMKG